MTIRPLSLIFGTVTFTIPGYDVTSSPSDFVQAMDINGKMYYVATYTRWFKERYRLHEMLNEEKWCNTKEWINVKVKQCGNNS